MQRERSWVDAQLQDESMRRLYEGSRLIREVTDAIADRIDRGSELSRASVAERLGVSRAHITQLLRGDRNMTVRSVADLAYACGIRLEVHPVDLRNQDFVESSSEIMTPRPRRRHTSGVQGGAGQILDDPPLAA